MARKLTAYTKCMGIELRKKNLKGKSRSERQRLFKEATKTCKR